MFLHSAWIFHSEPRVAPINSVEPPSLQSAQLCSPPHRGWLAHASKLPLHLSLPRQLSFTELSVVWLAACHRLYTPPPPPCAFSPASGWTYHKADMTSVPLCHAQGISAVDDTDILCNRMCRQSWPVKKVCGNGVNVMVAMRLVSTVTRQIGDWEINCMAKLKIGQLGCKLWLNVSHTDINFLFKLQKYFAHFICRRYYF